MKDKYHKIADISIKEAVDRCVKVYGFEGTEDALHRVYTHPKVQQLKKMFLTELYKRWK